MFEILIDSKESRSQVYKSLCSSDEVSVRIQELSAGDYIPHPDLAIERKTASDFVLSIMDRRLFAQVLRLKDEFAQVVFLIEGDPYSTRSAIQPDAIMAAISYLIAIEGVSVITVKNTAETVKIILNLGRLKHEGLGYVPALRGDKPKTTRDLTRYLVEGLPSIGPTSAASLIDHFGSAIAVFNASVEQLCGVPGIGKKTAERIRSSLDAKHSPIGKKSAPTSIHF